MELNISDIPPTICLNMIVKNESHIIKNTLEKLCKKIHFSYWVICDTGSTDNTPQIITDFFNDKNIPGELHNNEWKNFAHNRNIALNEAFNKTDLLLVFDADDEIYGNITMPKIVNSDGYLLNFGNSHGISYERILLVNNKIRWIFKSVIHEYINCLKANTKISHLEGDYFVESGRTGSRNSDPNKYLKDANILEEAYYEAKTNNDHLYMRYGFYCANSYKDAGKIEEAIKWYKLTLGNDNWSQEKYMCCLNLYNLYNSIEEKEKGLYYLVESFNYDSERMECVFLLIKEYCCRGFNKIAYNYYSIIKDFYENNYLQTNNTNKLFVENDKANFFLPYYMILVTDKVKETLPNAKQTIIKMYEIIFTKKCPITNDFYIGNLLYNLQFFIDFCSKTDNFIILANEYLDFLYKNEVNLEKYEFLLKQEYKNAGINLDNYLIKEVTNKSQKFSTEICKSSKNILFYTGFLDFEWNYTYMQDNALGGSEKAVAYLTKCFPKEYNIYISGHVKNEIIDNIQYIHLDELTNLINSTPFHTVIVSRYISFYEMFKECSYYQSYIWAHDVLLFYYGCALNESQILKKWNKYINKCICLTEWHKNEFIEKYPILKDKITLINNGIDCQSFSIETKKKITNKFIYSSRPERGLNILLELWPQILENIPDATLVISFYGTFPSEQINLKTIIDRYDSIQYLGKLKFEQLYEEMASSEYWLYPTHFQETSCITALEMLMSGVICLYYPVAGLVNTIGNYGIQLEKGQEIEAINNLTVKRKNEIIKRGKEYALSCSWANRANEWKDVIFKTNILFILPPWYSISILLDYFDSLNTIFNIQYTNDINYALTLNPDKVLMVCFEGFDVLINIYNHFLNKCEIALFNSEPLNNTSRLNSLKEYLIKYLNIKVYDYSLSNIEILNYNGFTNVEQLGYNIYEEENNYLTQINNFTQKIYDFGIILSEYPNCPPRRKDVVEFLIKHNFSVKIISGWKNIRDENIAKCRILLNIHGFFNNITTQIFEHLRCDRLLASGFNILSESCYNLNVEFIQKYPNLKLINYNEFFNLDIVNNVLNEKKTKNINKNICFIHSCHLKNKGLKRLDHLIKSLKNNNLFNKFETIYINNIGLPIEENIYSEKVNICNYSDNHLLYEIPTINKIQHFCQENNNCNILYLHTKGVSYNDDYHEENNWIDMMLYFLVEQHELCFSKLSSGIQTVGCNFTNTNHPPHFSGNFWWANANYISTLPSLIEKIENINPNDAEFWLCQNNPSIYELHKSNIDHYSNLYPPIMYKSFVFDMSNHKSYNIIINYLNNNYYSSAWLGHMNFACWIVELLKPDVIVDLGVDYGHSTFAFAAAKQGTVYGIDSFEGDKAGIKNTYDIVHKLNIKLIQDNLLLNNIHFIKGFFDDIYNTFNKTIDILHIDGLHTLEAITNDYYKWITKTTDNAVILFHDVVSYPDTVGKVFNEIQYPKFYFTHSAGLGVVCKNKATLEQIISSPNLPNKEFIMYNSSKK